MNPLRTATGRPEAGGVSEAQCMSSLDRRRAGVLLHPTSLPGAQAGGALGASARRFVDLIADSGFSVWQMLPVGPVDADPVTVFSRSVHAGNVDLIDLDDLATRGWIRAEASPHAGEAAAHFRTRKLLEALIGFENHARSRHAPGLRVVSRRAPALADR